jgi:hypothetical protein
VEPPPRLTAPSRGGGGTDGRLRITPLGAVEVGAVYGDYVIGLGTDMSGHAMCCAQTSSSGPTGRDEPFGDDPVQSPPSGPSDPDVAGEHVGV